MKFIKGLEVHDKSKKHTKTAAAPVAESADKVTDLIHSFNSMYLKGSSFLGERIDSDLFIIEENLRHFALEYLYLALIYFKKEIRVTHLNVLLNSLWNLFKKVIFQHKFISQIIPFPRHQRNMHQRMKNILVNLWKI